MRINHLPRSLSLSILGTSAVGQTIGGNDAEAKARVAGLLTAWFGWKHIIDLGDIITARGTEMYLPIWLRLWGALGTGVFNIQVIK